MLGATCRLLQEIASYLSRCLCITFGAPPSSLSDAVSGEAILSTTCNELHSLFWNFLLADGNASLMDIMPAVMSTIPKEPDAAEDWLAAVNDVWIDSHSKAATAAEQTTASLGRLAVAGVLSNHDAENPSALCYGRALAHGLI